MPTIVDVAKRAGVSLSTASDILNGKLKGAPGTAERVRQAVLDLGYRPNLLGRRLRTARAGAIGLVVPFRRPLFSSALLTDALAGIQAEQEQAGLNLLLSGRRYDQPGEAYGADLFESRVVDGLVVIGTRETYGRDLDLDVRALKRLGCPLVWLHHFKGKEQVDRIVRGGGEALREVLRSAGGRAWAFWRPASG
jgi:LacI family transcriptional regulator